MSSRYVNHFLQSSNLGDGRIDNVIIDSSAHVYLGVAVIVSLLLALFFSGRAAFLKIGISRYGKIAIWVTQIILALQILLGIKLLDQGQGISQLYIHYVGGLIPLAMFLVAGWFARGEDAKSSKILFVLILIGTVSAFMAFFIGRAFVNS